MMKSIQEVPEQYFMYAPPTKGNNPPLATTKIPKPFSQMNDAEKTRTKDNKLAKSYILQGITNYIYNSIDNHTTAKSMFDEITREMQGTSVGTQIKVMNCVYSLKASGHLMRKCWKKSRIDYVDC